MTDQSTLTWRGPEAADERLDMGPHLCGKTILIVQGSLLAGAELARAFEEYGARVYLTSTCINAFDIIKRMQFDGAVIDQGLHNAAFDLCYELRDLAVPHICAAVPHKLRKRTEQRREAVPTVRRMTDAISNEALLRASCSAIPQPRHESLAAIGS